MNEKIREVLDRFARLPVPVSTLSDDDDLFAAGMSSHTSVDVLLGLEDEFDVEFPDALLKRSVFESVSSLEEALSSLGVAV